MSHQRGWAWVTMSGLPHHYPRVGYFHTLHHNYINYIYIFKKDIRDPLLWPIIWSFHNRYPFLRFIPFPALKYPARQILVNNLSPYYFCKSYWRSFPYNYWQIHCQDVMKCAWNQSKTYHNTTSKPMLFNEASLLWIHLFFHKYLHLIVLSS